MSKYLIYDDYADAHSRADAEGMAQGLPYHTCCPTEVSRYVSFPQPTADGKYALEVSNYALTPEEESATVTEVEWPTEEETE